MELELGNRHAVVTGASRGIGLAIVRALLREGVSVIGVARKSTPETAAVQDEGDFRLLEADLGGSDGIIAVATQIPGPVDILINNVGSAPPRPGGFASITDEQWSSTYQLNALAAVRITRALFDRIPDGGAIVNIASENAILADPLVMDYSAAKAALLSFTKSLSKEVGHRGIRVNSISPGPVATDLWLGDGGVARTVAAATGGDPAQVRRGAEESMVTGRFTTPEEVAALAVMLASPVLGNLTGADVVIDGGLRPTM